MNSMNSPLSHPVPCSPERKPLYFFTILAVSLVIFLNSSLPSSVLVLKYGVTWSSPALA